MSSVCFLFFLKNDFSKVNKILVLTFLSQEKDFEGLKTFLFCFVLFFSFIVADFFSLMQCLQLPFIIRVEEAAPFRELSVSYKKRFAPKKLEQPSRHVNTL